MQLNVLIDASDNAVLCDFGLSHVKADVKSHTVRPDGGSVVGSRNWMAPERLLGGSLKKPCDIYSFGMTLYEVSSGDKSPRCDSDPFVYQIYANGMPLSELSFSEFVELVVRQDVRPKRPDDEDAPQLSDSIWELAETCWVKDSKQRPTASAVCDVLSHLLDTTSVARPTVNTSPLPLTPPSNLIIRLTDGVWCATFSLDGKRVAYGSKDCTIGVLDAYTGNPVLGPLKRHTGSVDSIAFSPNGRRIASGSNDCTILIWHATTGQVVAGPFRGHDDFIWSVCFSPDGKQIASGSKDQTIRIWDAQTGAFLIGPLRGHIDGVTSIVFSGNGARIASCSHDKSVRVWNAKLGTLVCGPFTGHQHSVVFVGFSPNTRRIVSASWEGNVCVWSGVTGALVSGPSLRHAEGAIAVAFAPNSTRYAVSPDGKWIAGYADNKCTKVHVWASTTGQLAASLEGQADVVTSMTFSPDGRRILTSSNDKTIRVQTLDY
jgi:WD40 repeat protein